MKDQIPHSESLKDTKARSRVYWDETIAPALKEGKTLLVVGHENNLRSLIMRLEGISREDIINLSLPRAVPLAYRLDENLKPLDRPDGKLDQATGFLRGEWLGGDKAVAEILARDDKNLELDDSRKKWSDWMNFVVGKPSPEAKAKGEAAA
jgi:2,3-bisphosphoglycerate-dependent phosphoglycerate mutase